MFVILKKDKVVFGPISWSPAGLSSFLATYNLNVSLPIEMPVLPIKFLDNIAIYPAVEVKKTPAIDEKIDGFTTIIESDKVFCVDNVIKLTESELNEKIAIKKNELRIAIQKKRQEIEWGGLDINIDGLYYRFDTDRDSQGMIHRTYQFMVQPINWKLADNVSWVMLTKDQLSLVLQAVLSHITNSFAKEQTLVTKLNTISINELYTFDLDKEWEKA